jgi:hypothetical protein
MVVFSYSGKRSAGRSATAAAAYRSASIIKCDREGRMHDYTATRGVEACFILAPANAPNWVQDRAALWNAAEARETRSNSVTARDWELALPSEISDAARIDIARAFAEVLVDRYPDPVAHVDHRSRRDGNGCRAARTALGREKDDGMHGRSPLGEMNVRGG